MSFPAARSSALPAPASAALTAFLRGVERRGAVFAELQAGDADAGDAALAAAMRTFRAEADALALSDWARRFWALLLVQPQLRRHVAVAIPIAVTDRLAELGGGPRAALLLRLAAELDEPAAAEVLGVAQASYRLALQRALPHHPDGRADPESWQRLRAQVHQRIKTLPPERLSRLARAREAAQLGTAPRADPVDRAAVSPPARGLLLGLWALLALCVLALAATFVPAAQSLLQRADAAGDQLRPLPEEAPAARYGAAAGLVSHRDFGLLADPQAARADDLAFNSWLAGSPPPGPAPIDSASVAGAAEPTAMFDVAAAGDPEHASEASHAPQ